MSDEKKVSGGRNDEFAAAKEYAAFDVEAEKPSEFPTKIEKSDIKPHAIGIGETEIILQRHGAYIRDREHPEAGSLSEESANVEKQSTESYFRGLLDLIPEAERDFVDILVVASDTQYFDKGRRSYETAQLAQQAAESVLEKNHLSSSQIINSSGRLRGDGGPKPMAKLREPNFLNDSPDFLDFMLKKYGGINLEFWIAFEDDAEKETRLKMGAEGPMEIADRTDFSVRVFARYAAAYHRANPGRRLIIWAATHYDTISPYVKREVFGVDNTQQLLVDYGGGIAIDIDQSGHATTEIANRTYEVPLKKSATT